MNLLPHFYLVFAAISPRLFTKRAIKPHIVKVTPSLYRCQYPEGCGKFGLAAFASSPMVAYDIFVAKNEDYGT